MKGCSKVEAKKVSPQKTFPFQVLQGVWVLMRHCQSWLHPIFLVMQFLQVGGGYKLGQLSLKEFESFWAKKCEFCLRLSRHNGISPAQTQG